MSMELDDALESGREQAAEYPEGPWPAVLAELDRRGAAIERVRELCADVMTEAVGGGLTNADTLWPSDVIAALDELAAMDELVRITEKGRAFLGGTWPLTCRKV